LCHQDIDMVVYQDFLLMAACEHCQLSCQYQVQVHPTRSQVLYSGILPEIPGELLVKIFIHKKKSSLWVLEKNILMGGGGKI